MCKISLILLLTQLRLWFFIIHYLNLQVKLPKTFVYIKTRNENLTTRVTHQLTLNDRHSCFYLDGWNLRLWPPTHGMLSCSGLLAGTKLPRCTAFFFPKKYCPYVMRSTICNNLVHKIQYSVIFLQYYLLTINLREVLWGQIEYLRGNMIF